MNHCCQWNDQGDCTLIEILRLAGLQKKSPQLGGGRGVPWKAVCFLVASDWFSTKCTLVNSPKSIKNEGRVSGSTHMNCFYLDSLCFLQSGRQSFRALPQSLAGAETQSLFGMKRYWKAGCSNWSLHLQTPALKAAGLWCCSVCVCVCIWFPQWTLGHCTVLLAWIVWRGSKLLSHFLCSSGEGPSFLSSLRRRDF